MLLKLTSFAQSRAAVYVNAMQIVAVRAAAERTEIVTTAHGGGDHLISVIEPIETVVAKVGEALGYARR